MNQARRILLVGHPEHRKSAAFHRAAALASVSATPLHIAILVEPFLTYSLLGSEIRDRLRQGLLNEQQSGWDKEIDILRAKGIQATCSVSWAENLSEEIICQVRELQPILLVKDIQREPAFRRAFVTPLDWHLLRSCPAPLHLVNDARHPRPKVIVAAVDLRDADTQHVGLNDSIIAAGVSLATQCDAELHLLFVHDNLPAYMAGTGEVAADWMSITEDLRAALQQSFVALAERHDIPQANRHFIIAQPTAGIIEFAQTQQADVVVMGRVHRRGVGKWLGTTIEAVLQRLPGSVLAIQPANGNPPG